MIGIYKIVNKQNGKYYVGSSINIEKRWKRHVCLLSARKHPNKSLQSDWDSFGKDNFEFKVLDDLNDEEKLSGFENWYLFTAEREQDCSYNQVFKTSNYFIPGRKHLEETKSKIRARAFGRKMSNETKEKIRKTLKEIKHGIGKRATASTRLKQSIARKGMFSDSKNPMYNKTVFVLQNTVTNEVVSGTRHELPKTIDLSRSSLCRLISRELLQSKNWKMLGQILSA